MSSLRNGESVEILGKIKSINRMKRGNFVIITKKSKTEYDCYYKGFLPIQIGDDICADGVVNYFTKYGSQTQSMQITISKPPFVQIPTNKDEIMASMFKAHVNPNKTNLFYDKLIQMANSDNDKKIVNYLNHKAVLWKKTNDVSAMVSFLDVITPTQSKNFLTTWHKNHVLRPLYLLGFSNKDISNASTSHEIEDIYDICLSNCYRIVELSSDKCTAIWERLGKMPTEQQVIAATITRTINEKMEKNGWMGVPSRIMMSLFPNLPEYLPVLRKDYDLKTEHHTVYLPYPYKVEVYVADYLNKLLDPFNIIIEPFKLKEASFTRDNLSDDQKEAIRGAISENISIITGGAGTGKTTVISEIIQNLEKMGINYMVVSFTGKAVSRLREVIKRRTPSTMHRMIAQKDMYLKNNDKLFEHLIIDEISMTTSPLFYEFITTFSHKFRITFVGDNNQLEPISYGCLFDQMLKPPSKIPIYKLIHIHRTVNDKNNGILGNANKIIEYSKIVVSASSDDMYEDDDNYVQPFEFELQDNFGMYDGGIDEVCQIIQLLCESGITPDKLTVITPYNKDVNVINHNYQKICNGNNKGVEDFRNVLWKVKDRVMMIENNYEINIMNGEEGTIVDVKENTPGEIDGSITVLFNDGAEHIFQLTNSEDLDNVSMKTTKSKTVKSYHESEGDGDFSSEGSESGEKMKNKELTTLLLKHSFCITVHASQGSEWDFIIVYLPQSDNLSSFINRKLLYTSLTRAKKAVWCIGNVNQFNLAAVKSTFSRCDNLSKRLNGFETYNY